MKLLEKMLADKTFFLEYFILALLVIRPGLDIWRDTSFGNWGNHTISLNAALSLLMFLASDLLIFFKRKLLKDNPLSLAWPLLLGWSLLTIFFSFDRTSTFLELIKLFNVAGLFFAAYILQKTDRKNFYNRLTVAACIGAVMPLVFAVLQQFTRSGLTIDGISNRIYGTFAHPNILAIYCLFLLGLIVKAKETIAKYTRLDYALILVLIGVILGTYTRSVWLALLICLGVYLFKKHRRAVYGLGIAVIAFYLLFFPVNYWLTNSHQINLQNITIIKRLTSRPANADSIVWRWWVARDSLKIFLIRPVAGFGYGTFPVVWDTYRDSARQGDPSSEAHNEYIRMLVETGFIGLVFYLRIFAALLKQAWQRAKKTSGKQIVFLMSVIIYCLLAGSENLLHHTAPVWWIFTVWGAWCATES